MALQMTRREREGVILLDLRGRLVAGEEAAALREAQLAPLRALRAGDLLAPSVRPLPESPAFWAPFVLLGEPH